MRLFIAINLNIDMLDALAEVQGSMRLGGVRGDFTREENLHLTLAFIGEYPDPDSVLDALETVQFRSFDISLSGYGNFGNLWWVGISDTPALEAVVRRVRRALADADIQFDRKRFVPHITILRKAVLAHGELPQLEIPQAHMTVQRISLMRSDRGRNGMIYTELGGICINHE